MVKAIIIQNIGGPEVLQIKDIKLPPLHDGEVKIKHSAIGLNFMDVKFRRGDEDSKTHLPAIPGFEACGIVEETKGDVGSLKIGDRVAYATAPMGAYCEARNIHHKYLVGVPDNITDEQAVAVLFKGMTAHYLTKRTYFVRPGIFVLVHAAAGGVGMFVTKLCKDAGARVIGTVGSDEKASIAEANGCDHVINYSSQDVKGQVHEITQNKGVSVVYDSVGAKTFLDSLHCLGDFGLMVSYGNSSGIVPAFNPKLLSEKNLFFTQPSLFKYKQHRMELCLSASEVFAMLAKGKISDNINYKYSFNEIAKAHADLENRLTAGSNIIVL